MTYLLPERCEDKIKVSEMDDLTVRKTNSEGETPHISIKASARDLQFADELNGVILGCLEDHDEVGDATPANIGKIAERIGGIDDACKVFLDISGPHCMAIVGTRGSGKSNALAVLNEELVFSGQELGTVLIDPIGVHRSSSLQNTDETQLRQLCDIGLNSKGVNCRVLIPSIAEDDFKDTADGVFTLPISAMNHQDWCDYWNFTPNSPKSDLTRLIITKCREGYTSSNGKLIAGRDDYDFSDLRKCLTNDKEINEPRKGYLQQTIRSIDMRLTTVSKSGLFSKKGTPISNIVIPGVSTIIDISHPNLTLNEKAVVVALITRKILEARVLSTRMGTNIIPVTWLLVEESQLFTGKGTRTGATSDIIDYAKTGRSSGCSLVLCTQQPSAIHPGIQSQLDLVISLRLTTASDIDSLKRFTPTVQPIEIYGSGDFIRGLPTGYAVIADQCTQNRPIIVSIRPRMSKHEGNSVIPGTLDKDTQIIDFRESPSDFLEFNQIDFEEEISIAKEMTIDEGAPLNINLLENKDEENRKLSKLTREGDYGFKRGAPVEGGSENVNAKQKKEKFAFITNILLPRTIIPIGAGFVLALFTIHTLIFQPSDNEDVIPLVDNLNVTQEKQVNISSQNLDNQKQVSSTQANTKVETSFDSNTTLKPKENDAEFPIPDRAVFEELSSTSNDDIPIIPTLMNTINILEDKE